MMKQKYLYIELAPYLREWLVHNCGGHEPLRFARSSIEYKILSTGICECEEDDVLDDMDNRRNLSIEVPPVATRLYGPFVSLTSDAQRLLTEVVRNRFKVALWLFLHKFDSIGQRQDLMIMDWMEENGIEVTDTNFNTIVKIYQRQCRFYRQRLKDK